MKAKPKSKQPAKVASRARKNTIRSNAPTRFKKIARPPRVWIGHAGKSSLSGAESRYIMIQQACIELDARGYRLRDIAEKISKRFEMGFTLSASSISLYLKKARDLLSKDIKEVQMVLRKDAFDELEHVRAKYLEIAIAPSICIKKEKIVDGEKIQYIDEDAFDKQIDALNGYLKVMQQQAALMGLNLKEIEEIKGEGNTADSLKIWILNNITQINQGSVPIGSDKPGFPMIDLSGGEAADRIDKRP